MAILDEALNYYKQYGFFVVPEKDKKPLIVFRDRLNRKPDEKEIREWWGKWPTANVAILTGESSNVVVIDLDTQESKETLAKYLPKDFACPSVITPRGGRHLYFQYEQGLGTYQQLMGGIELKGDGGKATLPPSIGINGKPYEWVKGFELGKVDIPPLPKRFLDDIKKIPKMENHKIVSSTMFTLSRRNQDLFHTARTLAKGRMPKEEALSIIHYMASKANPPYPSDPSDSPIETIVESAYRKERNLTQEIREWLKITQGWFRITEIYRELQIITKEDKNTVRVALWRLCDERVLERHPKQSGLYRRIEQDLEELNWKSANVSYLDLDWPLELNSQVKTTPGDIVVVAGESDSGKTAFALDFIVRNYQKFKINYFSSQLGSMKIKQRLEVREDIDWNNLNFKAWNRMDNFEDVIFPDEVNIIDFLMVTTDFWIVGDIIKNIHKKMKNHQGICIICLQKSQGKEFGRGGDLALDLAELYITFDRGGIAKILKAKNWLGKDNPNFKMMRYKIVGGWKIIASDVWHRKEDEEVAFGKKKYF